MLSASDRANLLLWGEYFVGNFTKANNSNLCKGIPLDCDKAVKVYMLMDLIDCSEQYLEDEEIDNLYRRLQCLIDLTVSS